MSVSMRALRGPLLQLRRPLPSGAWRIAVILAIAVVAASARTWVLHRDGGMQALVGYDPGVYYAAAASFVHGLMPYRDFLLLHPPGIVLLLSPFAAFASITSDPAGMTAARVAVILLGALNAALVTRIGYRFGPVAAITGGLGYALWLPVVRVETVPRLEPFGNTVLLLALLLLLRRDRPATGRAELLAGLVLGVGACVKIWGVLPLLVVLGWQLIDRSWRSAARVAAGAAAAGAAICLPFLLLAPDAMVRLVVTDQLGRQRADGSYLARVSDLIAAGDWLHDNAGLPVAASVAGVLMLLALLLTWQERPARVLAVLLAVQTGLLLAAPSFFSFYAAFVVPAAVLTLAVAAQRVAPRVARLGRVAQVAGVAMLAGAVAAAAAVVLPVSVENRPFPGRQLGAAAADLRCVLSDAPLALIWMNVLTRNLRNGCTIRVDVTGYTYERGLALGPDGRRLPRRRNPAWQQQVLGYLTSGDGVVLARRGTGLSARTLRQIARWPVVAGADGYELRARSARGQPAR